jgi:D-alanyl-D-alanine carboxypeptidase/D-alanyl-D-alanine-endopeptidase (penicillin-binding protein 4)
LSSSGRTCAAFPNLAPLPILAALLALSAVPAFPAFPAAPGLLTAAVAAAAAGSKPLAGAPARKAETLAKPPAQSHPKPGPQDAGAPGFAFPREALIGWAVRDPAVEAAGGAGALLESNRADLNLTPGSTQKLFTTWIALDLLGGDRTYVTELLRAGAIEAGVLKGHLVIRGGGDPSFGSVQSGPEHGAEAVFTAWSKALKEAGVKRIEGCVVGDGAYLEEEGPHPAGLWEDAGNYYAGTVSGLAFNDNLYQAKFSGAPAPGRTVAFLGTQPAHSGIARFENRLVTGPANGSDSAYILGGFPAPTRILRGTYPAGRMPFTIKGSLPNPAWTCARVFRDFLAAQGIAFAPAVGAAGCGDSLALPNHPPVAGAVPIPGARHVSPLLRDIVRIVNQKSDNNYAAQVLALIGKGTGRAGDFRGGLEAVQAWLDAHGFDRRRIHLKDGNGLSRYNWIAPSQTALLLSQAYRHPKFPEFKASLLGAPGATAKLDRFGPGWEGRLYAKTGTLEGVSALAGYLKCDSGKWIAFSIAANNFEAQNGDAQKYFGPLLRKWAGKY